MTFSDNTLPLTVGVFSSTLGHRGRKDIHEITVRDLHSQIPALKDSVNLVAHIKVSPGEDEVADKMEAFYRNWGFKRIIRSHGKWNNDSASHGEEYTKDIIRMLDDDYVQSSPYFMWLEDDWVFNSYVTKPSLLDFWKWSIVMLENDKNLLTVRFNADTDKDLSKAVPHELNLPITIKYGDLTSTNLYLQGSNYTEWGPTFTFQPSISRTRDLWHSYRFIRQNWSHWAHTHIELRSGYGLFPLSDSRTPFAFWDPRIINTTHIGHPPFELNIKR